MKKVYLRLEVNYLDSYNLIGSIFAGLGIALLFLLVFVIGAWFIGCWLVKKMLLKLGIETTAIMYVPFANVWTMISKIDCFGTFKLFSSDIPSQYVKIGAVFFPLTVMIPFIGPIVAGIIGVISLTAVYTRIWDVADGRRDGDSAVMGLLSSLISIVYAVKLILILIGNSNCTIDQFRTSGENFSAAVKQSKQPKERQIYDPNQQRMVTTTDAPSKQPQYKRVPRGEQVPTAQQFTPVQPMQQATSPQTFRLTQPPVQSTLQSGVQLGKSVTQRPPIQAMPAQSVIKPIPIQTASADSVDDSIL